MSKLRDAILEKRYDEAMYYTCTMLRDDQHDLLEDTWIELVARVGCIPIGSSTMSFGKTWSAIIEKLHPLLHAPQLHITEALEMTAMLILLFSKTGSLVATRNVATLRSEILQHFPEGVLLSYKGTQVYAPILPDPSDATFSFRHRLLAGFSKLFEEKDSKVLHVALEYLSRKKMQLPVLPRFAPSEKEASKGDPVWFLWAACEHALASEITVLPLLYELFVWNWRPAVKSQRMGLLWGIAHLVGCQQQTVWTKEDRMILQAIQENAESMWATVRQEIVENDAANSVVTTANGPLGPERSGIDTMDILYQHLPRVAPITQREYVTLPPEKVEKRVLHISSHSGLRSGNKDKIKMIADKYGETRDSDSRHRWIYFGTKGGGTEDSLSPEGS